MGLKFYDSIFHCHYFLRQIYHFSKFCLIIICLSVLSTVNNCPIKFRVQGSVRPDGQMVCSILGVCKNENLRNGLVSTIFYHLLNSRSIFLPKQVLGHCLQYDLLMWMQQPQWRTIKGTVKAQWICLRLPSWGPRFESKAHNQRLFHFQSNIVL